MIIQADVLDCPLKCRADLVYIDPPFNTRFNKQTKLSDLEFSQFVFDYLQVAVSLLDYNAWLVLCVGRYPTRYIIEKNLYEYFLNDLTIVQELIWYFTGGTYTDKKFVPSHEMIIVAAAGDPKFYKEEIRIPSQRLLTGDKRGDPRGRIPDDTFIIPRVTGNSKERMYIPDGYTCQPEKLCELIARNKSKELPDKFWDHPDWSKLFRRQVQLAASLLLLFDAEVIAAVLNDRNLKNVRSFQAFNMVPFFYKELEKKQLEYDIAQKIIKKSVDVTVAANDTVTPHRVKHNKLSMLRELNNAQEKES